MRFLLLVVAVGVARAQLLLHHGSCGNRCFMLNDYMKKCQCDSDCEAFNNCCGDFWRLCRGSELGLVVTQQELDSFAQSLWDHDVNRIDNAFYSLNYQGHTNRSSTTDEAVNPLIVPTDGQLDAILSSPNSTYSSFIQLLDNYERNVNHAENRPLAEIQEEDAFWAAASQTQIMQLTFEFLRDNGFIRGDAHAFRTVINELWFESNGGKQTESGFEDVMLGEVHRQAGHHSDHHVVVGGFSNWIQFYQEQKAGILDYQGYMGYLKDPPVVNVRFVWHNATANGKSFFVGTSPEFDMGLYTVCALARRNKDCNVTINGQTLTIQINVALHKEILQIMGAQIHFPTPTPTPAATNP